MLTTGNQLRAARALAEIEQAELAERAHVNVNTIRNMEKAGAGPIAGRSANVQAVQRALEEVGVEFLNHGEPGVRLRKPSRKPQPAADDEDDGFVTVYAGPAGKPLPRNYRDGANDLLSEEDRVPEVFMEEARTARIAKQDAEAAAKAGPKSRRTRAKKS